MQFEDLSFDDEIMIVKRLKECWEGRYGGKNKEKSLVGLEENGKRKMDKNTDVMESCVMEMKSVDDWKKIKVEQMKERIKRMKARMKPLKKEKRKTDLYLVANLIERKKKNWHKIKNKTRKSKYSTRIGIKKERHRKN